ncbi:MAG: phosphatidylglycerol lysyltransferase domain-containing protein [Oscillospiraceae bacterium]|nr:phosphatidylglycerol lysyltransferase domain-containing protein [Oscillospiraceae bacterium]
MLTFHPMSTDDRLRMQRAARADGCRSADYYFGMLFLWSGKTRYWIADGESPMIQLQRAEESPLFLWPVGSGDKRAALQSLLDYATAQGFPPAFMGLEERHAAELETLFPGCFEIQERRNWADYIYEADRLISLSGKHLHGKRNHISRFLREHDDWHFEELTPALFPDCLALADEWSHHADNSAGLLEQERCALERAFAHYDTLALLGGALFAGEQLIAFTMGEHTAADTFDVHFEKAHGEINGAFPMVNREFVQLIKSRIPEVVYINREDDMGQENLRRSKESYYPAFLLRKFSARWRADS